MAAVDGMFFSFDGIDGVGKSTQIGLFCDWLRDAGRDVITCRDPGSTRLGEVIRDILLQSDDTPIDRRSEMLLYMAARAQLVQELIRPALARGKTVVCDRFLLANVVYQGHAGGLPVEEVRRVGQVAVAGLSPALTFLLDMDARAALDRIQGTPDRMEAQGLAYMEKVRDGFLAEAALQPDKIIVVDAARDVETIQNEIRNAAQPLLDNLT